MRNGSHCSQCQLRIEVWHSMMKLQNVKESKLSLIQDRLLAEKLAQVIDHYIFLFLVSKLIFPSGRYQSNLGGDFKIKNQSASCRS